MKPTDKTGCFLGVLYPAKQVLWHLAGNFPIKLLDEAAKFVSAPSFWAGMEFSSNDVMERTYGRLVESLTMKDDTSLQFAHMLALAVFGMSDHKYLWLKVEEHQTEPAAPEGKVLEASFMIYEHILDATNAQTARRLFFDDMEVGLASSKMWLLKPHEGKPFIAKRQKR